MKTKLINYRTYNTHPARSTFIPIDRRSIFGNPYVMYKEDDRKTVILMYKNYFYKRIKEDSDFRNAVHKLKGKILICWCRPDEGFLGRLLCHGQIIIAYLEECKPEEVE